MLISINKINFTKIFVFFVICNLFFSINSLKTEFNKTVILSEQLVPVISNPKTHKRVHAATIAEISNDHVIAAYFGGTDEGKSDVRIWLSHGFKDSNDLWNWQSPYVVADSYEIPGQKNKPCYNPVLFRFDKKTLFLFYKIGKSPMNWKGYLKKSFDGGNTWSKAEDLSKYNGAVGPTRCKPIRLNAHTILCGSSEEGLVNWNVRMEIFKFLPHSSKISCVKISSPIEVLNNPFGSGKIKKDNSSKFAFLNHMGIIQPTIFFSGNSFKNDGEIKIICRGKGTKYLISSNSKDFGDTWSPVEQTGLVNAGGDCGSGLDSVKLKNGNILIVRNDLPEGIKNSQCGDRSKLVLDISKDNGTTWKTIFILEATSPQEGKQNCYPSIIQASDGLIHVVYTFDKIGNENRIKHVVLDSEGLE
jgi:alpha-L-rhamnosidase